jgi:hypothetical protein
LPCAPAVAHRASRHLRRAIPAIAALAVAAAATLTVTTPAQAAYSPRVVIVVGPTHGSTANYLQHARAYARQARAYGASVETVFHPHATWPRVIAAAQGANVFIYLGHGNGWPSPYAPNQGQTKNGLGLNPYHGASQSNVKYYGSDFVRSQLRFAPGAVVLFNRLCYASGNGEPGMGSPSWRTAVKRADNYAAPFIAAGASAVVADGVTTLGYELARLFGRSRTNLEAWRSDPDAHGNGRAFRSERSPGYTVRLDPNRASRGFYRSIVTRDRTLTSAIRISPYRGTADVGLVLRRGADSDTKGVKRLSEGARYVVRGSLVRDDRGRTWAPVLTRSGHRGYVAAWATSFVGTAVTRSSIHLRRNHSVKARSLGMVAAGARVGIRTSARDRNDRAWLKVRTPNGRVGWIAAWLTRP